MKRLIFTAFVLPVMLQIAFAQQRFSAEAFHKNMGKTGTLCDTVYALKIYNDTLTLLYMGGINPGEKYTIAVTGNRITLDWAGLKGKPLCVTGVFELYKGRPGIEVADPERINLK